MNKLANLNLPTHTQIRQVCAEMDVLWLNFEAKIDRNPFSLSLFGPLSPSASCSDASGFIPKRIV